MKSMGWEEGLEPSTSNTTNWRSNQLSYTHHWSDPTLRPEGDRRASDGGEGEGGCQGDRVFPSKQI